MMPLDTLTLPPLMGRTDPVAEEQLAAKREAARQWMKEKGIEDLGAPPSPTMMELLRRYARTTEGPRWS